MTLKWRHLWSRSKKFRNKVVRKYKDKTTGCRIVEVGDLSFISDRDYPYNWFERHYQHKHCKHAVKRADVVIAEDEAVAKDIVRYYFTPKSKIRVRRKS